MKSQLRKKRIRLLPQPRLPHLRSASPIPLAQAFGAGEYRQLRRYVAGCVWLGLIMSAVLLAVTLPGTRGLLRLMGTPEEQMDYAFNYIFIIFVGIPTTILYNMGA